MKTTVVLVHGAWHGAECWEPIVRVLNQRGVAAVSVHLPFTGLDDDTAAVQSVVDGLDRPVVCGHSYGGTVITGLVPANVGHLVYVAATMPDCGETAMDVTGTDTVRLVDGIVVDDEGWATVDLTVARDAFYNDCSDGVAAMYTAKLRPLPITSMLTPVRRAAWREVPSTYVVCTNDQAAPVEMQRRVSERAGVRTSWPTGHLPWLSRPDMLADLLQNVSPS